MTYPMKKIEKFLQRIAALTLLASIACILPAVAQDEPAEKSEEATEKSEKQLARPAFESAMLIDAQSVIVPSKGTLEFDMQHRFGSIENGISDFYGIYAPGANIRLGFTYSPIENLSLGFGYAKLKSYLDFNAKYSILKQTKDWGMPVSMTYYGNMAIDTRQKDVKEFEKEVHRLCFQNELIIAVRINSKLSLQITPSYSHFNAVDSVINSEDNSKGVYSNDIIGLAIYGRYKFSPQSSIVFGTAQQLTSHDDLPGFELQPGYSLGWEISTSSHAFQIFITNFQGIIPQENMVYNQNDFFAGDIVIGFNITRLWSF